MSKSEFAELLKSCDELIRAGRVAQARKLINENKNRELPREIAERFAYQCYRVGLFSVALRTLSPLVRPESAIAKAATAQERATYAICLIKIGSIEEGLGILAETPAIPEVSLYRAFAEQAQWNYAAAIPHLEIYLSSPGIGDYERAVGQVNLLAALISSGQTASAQPLCDHLFKAAKENRWTLLYKNLQELSAQIAVAKEDWHEAHRRLLEASNDRYLDDSIWDFFVRKWSAIIDIRSDGATPERIERLRQLRAEAVGFGHWETVRECDSTLARALRDGHLFRRVYFGTPFSVYREKMLKECKDWVSIPDSYVWCPQESPTGRILDTLRGTEGGKDLGLKLGQAVHRALLALSSDFYRPLFVGQMHAQLFPGEYYNPVTSPQRVRNVIKRLRGWMRENEIPLSVKADGNFFRLAANGSYGLQVFAPARAKEAVKQDPTLRITLERLKGHWPDRGFSSIEAAKALGLSKSSVIRVLNLGVEQGRLVREGNNRNTRYRITG